MASNMALSAPQLGVPAKEHFSGNQLPAVLAGYRTLIGRHRDVSFGRALFQFRAHGIGNVSSLERFMAFWYRENAQSPTFDVGLFHFGYAMSYCFRCSRPDILD
jgi:hypothetical protein